MEAVGDLVVPPSEKHHGKEGVETDVHGDNSSFSDEHPGIILNAYDQTVRKLRPRHMV